MESGAQARTGVEPGQAEAASTSSGGGRAAVACAALSMLQVEALLPPPFPSNKPFRLYVSNMAVVPDFRRRGLARQLLRACERQARLWGHSSLWLHVNKTNLAAIALYSSMGFRPVEEGGLRLLPGPLGQLLMAKDLPPLAHGCPVVLRRGAAAAGSTSGAVAGAGAAPGEVGVTGVAGSKRGGDGVFVWNAVVGKGGQGGEGSEQS
ncbi:hypothetical protein HYH03_004694 [Edaphochlamys debaryana]|uniref:N-acetyltransferase domain-containing protein n=1 Tax=Edaphochlamys debaryana TaxID=47281 RepID=A0A835Y6U3_9CHLO|nr:hypothetical protein HYH03_004694 [Edaphochlamys debaryana]|eukprot:KAG2497103.1 hypothetical protein HYH03_004694 [Edaphochlamys debaryana]